MQFRSRAACEKPNVLQVHFLLFWTWMCITVHLFFCWFDVRHERFFYYVSSFIFVLRHHHGSYVHEIHGKRKKVVAQHLFDVAAGCLAFGVWHWTCGFGVGHLYFVFGDGRQWPWHWKWTFGSGQGCKEDQVIFFHRLQIIGQCSFGLLIPVFGMLCSVTETTCLETLS